MSDAHLTTSSASGVEVILRLYVAGITPQSGRAITNLKRLCETHLKGRCVYTIIDLYQNKEAARRDQVVVAPMLVRESPLPERRVIGDLSNTERVIAALELSHGDIFP